MVTKGALSNILDISTSVETKEGCVVKIASMQDQIQKHFSEFSKQGFRTLGIAYKNRHPIRSSVKVMSRYDVYRISYSFDPPKANIAETIASLKKLGVSLKIITGDNHLVATSLSEKMGLSNNKIITAQIFIK